MRTLDSDVSACYTPHIAAFQYSSIPQHPVAEEESRLVQPCGHGAGRPRQIAPLPDQADQKRIAQCATLGFCLDETCRSRRRKH
jgi:hypothetical protein